MKRICPYSKLEYIARRSNQIYVDSKARIKANNLKQKALRDALSRVYQPLKNNYIILKSLMRNKKEDVFYKLWLQGKGLSMNNITGVVEFEGSKRFCIYEFIIIPMENDKIKIVVND